MFNQKSLESHSSNQCCGHPTHFGSSRFTRKVAVNKVVSLFSGRNTNLDMLFVDLQIQSRLDEFGLLSPCVRLEHLLPPYKTLHISKPRLNEDLLILYLRLLFLLCHHRSSLRSMSDSENELPITYTLPVSFTDCIWSWVSMIYTTSS